ncbi:unnamed protein product [Adineta ricciae]|uniref:Uncharacterized protein n=1 Tax=Adineta ricciae TaxID=249248 RepID=A0A814KAW3_ADIRI|nr:unnamed protein product [Adineta ricciae]
MFNLTHSHQNENNYYLEDNFAFFYEDETSLLANRSYYDDLLTDFNHKIPKTSFFSLSSPFIYLIFIIISYLFLTMILLTFSLYKQRQTEVENFYFGDSDEDVERGKRHFAWKQHLIGKICKGDMQPLLNNNNNDERRKTDIFPIHIV